MDEPNAKSAIAFRLPDLLLLEASGAVVEAVRGSYPEGFHIDTNSAAAKYKWGFRVASNIAKTVGQETSILSRLVKINPIGNLAFTRLAALNRLRFNSLKQVEAAATFGQGDKPMFSKVDSRKRARSPSPNGVGGFHVGVVLMVSKIADRTRMMAAAGKRVSYYVVPDVTRDVSEHERTECFSLRTLNFESQTHVCVQHDGEGR